jgi:hypothetical protein
VDLTSLANPNAAFVNAAGESAGRVHNFKASGSYELPWKIVTGANFRLQSGLPITRTWQIPSSVLRQGSVTVNAEPRGSVELPWLPTLDLRAGRYFRVAGSRLELSVDAYNATNANTVFGVRTNAGTATIRVDGNPANPPTVINAFLSPTSILAPRVFRFNVTASSGGSDRRRRPPARGPRLAGNETTTTKRRTGDQEIKFRVWLGLRLRTELCSRSSTAFRSQKA